jgi:hypothetical protein
MTTIHSSSQTKHYIIGICQLYNPNIHGINENYFYSHFIYLFDIQNIYEYQDSIEKYLYQQNIIRYLRYYNIQHPTIRNYKNIVKHKHFINPDILQIIYFIDNEGNQIYLGIKKTFWLRLIQRTWKNIIKKRKKLFIFLNNIKNLRHKEIYGKWSFPFYYPTLKGMLNKLL